MSPFSEIPQIKQTINHLCVFCGSSSGSKEIYKTKARELGKLLADEKITLVYGGGSIGLMGEIANSVLENHGHVIGVIPEALSRKELIHDGVPDMRIVKDMHERKATMAELSDGFIAMPGGFGTFEELLEIITWAQLQFHYKPIGILNTDHYYDPLISLIDHAVEHQFIHPDHQNLIVSEKEPLQLLNSLINM